MIAPPMVMGTRERRKPVWKKRHRIQARVTSSKVIVAMAATSAAWYCGIRKGRVCRTPPRNVPAPVIEPRWYGLPRPVRFPVSDRLSEKAMLTPAPIAVANRATNA
jgi:hypothetical protein